jgi:predicted O-methyltransferase YrrM
MFKKHHTLKYVFNKLRQIKFEKQNPTAPWLTKEAIEILDQLLKPTDVGLEFGSGRSTHWLANRSSMLYSVENNEQWFEIVSKQIAHLNHVRYYLKSIDKEQPENSNYLDVLNELSSDSIDFILNDGKIRDYVAIKSIDKLKAGGLIIIDNAERYLPNNLQIPNSIGNDFSKLSKEWFHFIEITNTWRKIWTSNGVWSTLIFIKP